MERSWARFGETSMRLRLFGLMVVVAALFLTLATGAAGSQRGDSRNCSDFATWQEAQAFFLRSGPGDPNRLDRDHDGIACEGLPGAPTPSGAQAPVTPTPRRVSAAPAAVATATAATAAATGRAEAPSVSPTAVAPGPPSLTPDRTTRPTQTPRPTATRDVPQELGPDVAPTATPRERGPADRADLPRPAPPARLWVLIVSTTELVAEDESSTPAQPGAWYLVVGPGDGWFLVAPADDGPAAWVRIDSRIQIVPQWGPDVSLPPNTSR